MSKNDPSVHASDALYIDISTIAPLLNSIKLKMMFGYIIARALFALAFAGILVLASQNFLMDHAFDLPPYLRGTLLSIQSTLVDLGGFITLGIILFFSGVTTAVVKDFYRNISLGILDPIFKNPVAGWETIRFGTIGDCWDKARASGLFFQSDECRVTFSAEQNDGKTSVAQLTLFQKTGKSRHTIFKGLLFIISEPHKLGNMAVQNIALKKKIGLPNPKSTSSAKESPSDLLQMLEREFGENTPVALRSKDDGTIYCAIASDSEDEILKLASLKTPEEQIARYIKKLETLRNTAIDIKKAVR